MQTEPPINPATNYVLVRPEGEPGRIRSGIAATDAAEGHLLRSCIGTVIAVCPDLYYGGYDILKAKGKQTPAVVRALEYSVQFDVPIEVVPGDRVIFESTVNITESTIWLDDLVLFRYDLLLGRLNRFGPLLPGPVEADTDYRLEKLIYPLNGRVFIERFDSHYNAGGVASHETMMPGYGRVLAEGCRVKSYMMWPEKGPDFDIPLTGRMVMFKPKHAVRIEHDAYRILQGDGRYPLYELQRYSINGFVNNYTKDG